MRKLIATAVLSTVSIYALGALAHDHHKPNLDSWYESLKMPQTTTGQFYTGGISCCNRSDCHETESELRADGVYARLGYIKDGEWNLLEYVKVPEEKILKKQDNPTGNPVICHSMAWVGTTFAASSVTIYCFVESNLY